jgi:hypothetical protein
LDSHCFIIILKEEFEQKSQSSRRLVRRVRLTSVNEYLIQNDGVCAAGKTIFFFAGFATSVQILFGSHPWNHVTNQSQTDRSINTFLEPTGKDD